MRSSYTVALCGISFLTGLLMGGARLDCSCSNHEDDSYLLAELHSRTLETDAKFLDATSGRGRSKKDESVAPSTSIVQEDDKSRVDPKLKNAPAAIPSRRFNPSLGAIATGASRVRAKEFSKVFDMGIPIDEDWYTSSTEDVLILYGNKHSLPSNFSDGVRHETGGSGLPRLTPKTATENCNHLNVLLSQKQDSEHCLAIMPYDNDITTHSQAFFRVKKEYLKDGDRTVDHKEKLRHVGHGVQEDTGSNRFIIPPLDFQKNHYNFLGSFLRQVDSILEELRPIVNRVARNNTVAAVTTNEEFTALLMNFACMSHARSINITDVIVFATDENTRDTAESLGMTVYYNEKLFAEFPKEDAHRQMVYAQAMSTHLLTLLGCDIIVQDIDVIWYKHPLEYFSSLGDNFDLFFMADGAKWNFFAPYGANAGLYYIRNNDRTRTIFTDLLYRGDNIVARGSDQSVLNGLLSFHASQNGLRVKVIPVDDPTGALLGGIHYHSRPHIMRQLMNDTLKPKPYTFHMHWTSGADTKIEYFRQMGAWYVRDKCANATPTVHWDVVSRLGGTGCCSKEPLVKCYWRDKASIVPCRDSPSVSEGAKSFW